MTLRFDGRVAIVTGAGGGLGRAYALELAKRGARVVVNDLGTSFKGEGKSAKAADAVVEEIRQAGGEAVGNYDSVTDGAKIVQTALDKWGQVDIVINNAGILRDVSFAKMTEQDWKLLHDVHLTGSYAVTKAAWEAMRKRNFGRIIMVGSAAGLYGNHGQANYSTVKMGLVGLSNTLAQEGKKINITCNTIAPVAGSRMTETVLPPDLLNALKAEYVSPLVLYLVHESCKESGGVYEVGAGWMSKLRWERTKGHFFPLSQEFTIESVRDNFEKIRDFTDATHPVSTQDAFGPIMANLESAKSGGTPSSGGAKKQKAAGAGAKKGGAGGGKAKGGKSEKAATVDVAAALAHKFEPQNFSYTDKEVILYALGVGAAADPWDDKELRFTYENHPDFQVLPTFGVVVPSGALGGMFSVPGLSFNPMMLLHGEQYMELKRPFPTSGTLTSEAKIAGVYDKGKGALLLMDVHTKDDKGQDILYNQYSMFIRGLGGFGGPKSPAQPSYDAPARPPDVVHREAVPDNQALLYRLSGDRNPLHADPAMASVGGFNKPILHGLCSFGYATRAVLKHFCDNDVKKFKSIKVRFVKHVFPGETLITEMWQVAPTQIIFRVKVAERGDYVLSNCMIELHGDGSEAAAPAAATPKAAKKESKGASAATSSGSSSSSGGSFKADAVFAELKKRVNADAVNKVKASYRFDITQGSATRSWLVDLKSGSGSVAETGKETPADCQITMKDDDFVALMNGKLNPQSAFMKGQLKVKGNMMLAQKLSVLTAQPAKL